MAEVQEKQSWLPVVFAVGVLLVSPFGWLASGAGQLPDDMAALARAGTAEALQATLKEWRQYGSLEVARRALRWDTAFLAAYGALLALLAVSAGRWASQRGGRWWAAAGWAAAALAAAAAVLDLVENVRLREILNAPPATAPPLPLAAVSSWKLGLAVAAGAFCLAALLRSGALRVLRELPPVLSPIWFHVFLVVGLGVALMVAGQAQDMVRRLGEIYQSSGRSGPMVGYVLCSTLWAVLSWFWTRLLLSAQFHDTPKELKERGTRWFVEWIPRLLALEVFILCAAALWTVTFDGHDSGGPDPWGPARETLRIFGFLELWVGATVFAVLAYRRKLVFFARGLRAAAPGQPSGPELTLNPTVPLRELLRNRYTLGFLLASTGVGVALLVAFTVAPVFAGDRVGAVGALLLSASFWMPLGSVLVIAGRIYRFAAFRWTLAAVALFSLWNDNHRLRPVPSPEPGLPAERRETVSRRLERWVERIHAQRPEESEHVIYLVASEGGGIRAAYWTAALLAQLEKESDQARAADPKLPLFSERLFAISGVSGGSVGAAVFAGRVADGTPPARMPEAVAGVLGRDLLAPVLGSMLFPDLLQRLLPVPVLPDRAAALEESWEAAWRDTPGGSDPELMGRRFMALWAGERDLRVPALFLNATLVEAGNRVVTSNLQVSPLHFPDAEDTFEFGGKGADLRLSSAAHLSARFPYVSPGATFDRGHLVDGGYFENSGASTLQDVLNQLELYRDPVTEPRHRLSPAVIIITNGDAVAPEPARFLSELTIPVSTMLNARGARAVYAQASMSQEPSATCTRYALHETSVPLPLGWVLSDLAQQDILGKSAVAAWKDGRAGCGLDGPACECTGFGAAPGLQPVAAGAGAQ